MSLTKRNKWVSTVIIGSIFIILLILGTCTGGALSPLPYRYLDTFSGKVIDSDSKKPIPGAAVLAVYYKQIPSIAGSNTFVVDGQETLSDEKGEFRIPRKIRFFPLLRGYTEGKLILFKPGYGAFPRHKRSKAVGESKSWPPPKKYIVYEIPMLKTREERKKNARMRTYHEIPYEKQRFYIEAINAERKSLGLPLMQVPDKER